MLPILVLLLGASLFRISTDTPLTANASSVPPTQESENTEDSTGHHLARNSSSILVTAQGHSLSRSTIRMTTPGTIWGARELSSTDAPRPFASQGATSVVYGSSPLTTEAPDSPHTDKTLLVTAITISALVPLTNTVNRVQLDTSRTSAAVTEAGTSSIGFSGRVAPEAGTSSTTGLHDANSGGTHFSTTVPPDFGIFVSTATSMTEAGNDVPNMGTPPPNEFERVPTDSGRNLLSTARSVTSSLGYQNPVEEEDQGGRLREGTDRTIETSETKRETGDMVQVLHSESPATLFVSQSSSSVTLPSRSQHATVTESLQDASVTRDQPTSHNTPKVEENDESNGGLVVDEKTEPRQSYLNASKNSQDLEEGNHIVWFLLMFRGNCDLLNVTLNSTSLKTAFHRALISLLLYNASHVTVTNVSCTGFLNANVSIDAYFYPNCEQDLRLLQEHDNINLRVNGVFFNLVALETSRDHIFSTREADMLSSGDGVLLIILGAIGIAALGLGVAAFFYILIQAFLRKKHEYLKSIFAEASVEPRRELSVAFAATQIPRPRLKTKSAEMNSVDRSSQASSMYKSYIDLTCPELYAGRDGERMTQDAAVTPIGNINGIIVSTNDHIIKIKNHDYDDPCEDTPDGPTVRFDIPEETSKSQYYRRRGEVQRHSMKAISNDNLFLTQVTFLGEDNPAFRIETNL